MSEGLKLSRKVVECPVCNKNTAIEEEEKSLRSWLCVSCGFTANESFVDNNKAFESTPQNILKFKHWDNERKIYWIPTVINIPSRGLILPEPYGKRVMWKYLPIATIPIEEQHNYPIQNQPGKYHTQKLDTDNSVKTSNFYEALKMIGAIVQLDELEENIIEEN